ncbi:hypothetical protein H0H93_001013 [Arthromyces matolae]|nr:hypothetical protein H0H93_001013 [Arthromyces matolae]
MADSTPTLPVADIISVAEDTLGGRFNGIPPRLEYLVQRDGSVALVHVIQIVNEAVALFLEAFVDAHTGQLVSVIDFVAHDSYTVVPFNWASPLDGQKIINNPADPQISPGWHNLKALVNQAQFREDTTSGNNIFAYSGILQPAQETSEVDNFNTRYDLSIAPTEEPNVQAAIVNAFYVANTFHDLVYLYGFTEDAFNFQASDYGHGGKDGDPVFLSVQDPSGTNNANFATPPEVESSGQPGICRMYLWTLTNPGRDGAMENSIVIHEMTHGLTNRLTGGGTGRCLQTLEAGGMGEGWSDAMAE